jgi:diadenosine tetraphosphatase ApaH/serine/threonine PP2A family protein phosphatase
MLKNSRRLRGAGGPGSTTKYDAHHKVLDKTYGAQAELRRELSDSKAAVAERTELLHVFADCDDPQRAWLLLEDYFERLSLSRKDFASHDWWPRVMAARGKQRLEETAIVFLRSSRPLPTELLAHANPANFARIERLEKERQLAQRLEHWLFPSAPARLDTPRAALRVACEARPVAEDSALHGLAVSFHIFRQRTGEKARTLGEVVELTNRAAHEQELYSAADWEFIQWLAESNADPEGLWNSMVLTGLELLQWLVQWGDKSRLLLGPEGRPVVFHGDLAGLKPQLEEADGRLFFTHHLALPSGHSHSLDEVKFFSGRPALALVGGTFYLLRSAPPDDLLNSWAQQQALPVDKLSRRLLTQLRKTQSANGPAWEQLCEVQKAVPRFTFELNDDVVRMRLLAKSEADQSLWLWNNSDWQAEGAPGGPPERPTILDDPRLGQRGAMAAPAGLVHSRTRPLARRCQ